MAKDTILTKLEEAEDATNPSASYGQPGVNNSCEIVKVLLTVVFVVVIVTCTTCFHLRLSVLEDSVRDLRESGCLEMKARSDLWEADESGKPNRVKRHVDQERHGQRRRSTHSRGSHSVEFLRPKEDEDSSGYNNESVLLTSTSRIPLMAIQDFCSKTKDYCPAGTPGPIGLPGVKGERGHKGEIGPKGPLGPVGYTGQRGEKGAKGESGRGLSGRDGLPGEPGLDGIPGRAGRAGLDGLPANDGVPGVHGKAGADGTNGKKGDHGQKGDMGARGLPGLMGPIGPAGQNGIPGIPGVNTTVIAGTVGTGHPNTTILIPPSILGYAPNTPVRPLVVMEGETVRLGCSATGSPPPKIKWTRDDGSPIYVGSVAYSAVEDRLLNFTQVNRAHMGRYICYADNAITPSASRAHDLHVNFGPTIKVNREQVSIALGRPATLECDVEAFPRGATSWQTAEGKFITANDEKYEMTVTEGPHSVGVNIYRVKMTLRIKRTIREDTGIYYCLAKNTLGITRGIVTLGEWTSGQPAPDPSFIYPVPPPRVYGNEQPKLELEETTCPPPPKCEDCAPRLETTAKCVSSGYHLFDKFAWKVERLRGYEHPEDRNRSNPGACTLAAVGKPVFHGSFQTIASWMREGYFNGTESEKYYTTRLDQNHVLYEYSNKTAFTGNQGQAVQHQLAINFQGNFHTIYRGNFFYVAADSDPGNPLKIIQYSLTKGRNVSAIELPHSSGESSPLYAPRSPPSTSKVDLAVDENGLWAIYALPGIPNTVVVKIELEDNGTNSSLRIVYGWNITIGHKHAGDMWITCGVLYATDSVTEMETKIRLGIDLYRQKVLKPMDLTFTNPFTLTTMVSYIPNPKAHQLATVDGGNLLVYPIKHSGPIEDDR